MLNFLPTDPWRLGGAVAATLLYLLLCACIWRRHRADQASRQTAAPPPGVMPATAAWQASAGLQDQAAHTGRAPIGRPPSAEAGAAAAAAAAAPSAAGGDAVLIAYASQTGTAEAIAGEAARQLRQRGIRISALLPLAQLDAGQLAQAGQALFVASTCGEGDPPDDAALFADRFMSAPPGPGGSTTTGALKSLRYGLLALGDRSYRDFCAFGRQLDHWLQDSGARPLFSRIEADKLDAGAMQQWQAALQHWPGAAAEAVSHSQQLHIPGIGPWQSWRLQQRRCLNPGSIGQPLYLLDLLPADGSPLPDWAAGDIAQVLHASESSQPRDYSIASVRQDGCLQLLVRQEKRSDGSPGLVSGWLCSQLLAGETLCLRLRGNPRFQQAGNAGRPLILVGNGSGMAGLRAHLRARAHAAHTGHTTSASPAGPATPAGHSAHSSHATGRTAQAAPMLQPTSGATAPCWLVFGERQAAFDQIFRDETDAWQASGLLARCDRVFSRDEQPVRYVQTLLEQQADTLQQWLANGAALYICGRRQGMGTAVEQVLEQLLTKNGLQRLRREGRYCRDVY